MNEFWFEFCGYGSRENLMCELDWTNSFLMSAKILLECVSPILWVWKFLWVWVWKKKKKIVLLGMEKFCLDIEISCWSWNIFLLVVEKFCLDMEIFVGHGGILFGHWIFCWSWDFFVGMSILGWVFCGHLDDWPTLFCRTLRVKAASRCWKAIWEILSSDIKNIIDEAGF